jgi:lipopolysaccharide export system protein LptC
MSKQTFISGLLLLTALFFSVWFIYKTDHKPTTTAHNSKTTPDAFMVGAEYVSFDTNGKPRNSITVLKMMHYPANNASEFTDPSMVFYSDKGEPWHVSANSGQSQAGISEIHLWNNVKIHQPAGPKNREITITTTSLTIFPSEESVITNAPITIKQPGAEVYSVGLRADLKKGEVQLLSGARAVYQALNN